MLTISHFQDTGRVNVFIRVYIYVHNGIDQILMNMHESLNQVIFIIKTSFGMLKFC